MAREFVRLEILRTGLTSPARDLYNAASTATNPATVDDPLKTPPTVPRTEPEVAHTSEAHRSETNAADGPVNPAEPSTEGTEHSTDEGQDIPVAPTTRSKTAPHRKEPTPTRESSPKPDALITLSDINAAKEVLADRANAHWAKGLGGGQNKEGETIVNFLYKLKVEPGELRRPGDEGGIRADIRPFVEDLQPNTRDVLIGIVGLAHSRLCLLL